MIISIFILLIAFQLKHFLADYVLQNSYMLGKFNIGWSFFFPLCAHTFVHGVGILIICLIVNPVFWWLAIVDIILHFIIDRIKASPKYLGRFNDKTKSSYWNILGFDQMCHHLSHYTFIAILIGVI